MNTGDTVPPNAAKIDISDAVDIHCQKCDGTRFEHVYLLKRLSSILSPTGKEEIIPLGPPIMPPIWACYACGHVNEEFIPAALRARKPTPVESSTIVTSKDPLEMISGVKSPTEEVVSTPTIKLVE